jgi:SAM-dependent methyltransferase
MNSKIFSHIIEKLHETWHLPRYQYVRESLTADTVLDNLPWTPARKEKLCHQLEETFGVDIELTGTVTELVNRTDERYLLWFFGKVWKPRTDLFEWTGWKIAEEIKKLNPRNVLDVGCGYNQFKKLIPNLIGIDPYNDCADYMVDILEYQVEHGTHDHVIALGSINFNSREDIESRFSHCINLLEPGGHLWMRCNPGIDHWNGPWVEVFPWSFDVAHELAKKYNLTLKALKKDNIRLFFLFVKN